MSDIDWRAVAVARRNLRALAAERPDLCGPPSEENREGWITLLTEEEDDMGKKQSVMFRFDPELVARLDAHAERLTEEMSGLTINRSDVVRMFLLQRLAEEEAEAEQKEKKRRGRK